MLDPEIQPIVELMEAADEPPAHLVPIAQARAAHERETEVMSGPGEDVAEVREVEAPGPGGPITVRLFRPLTERAAGGAALPLVAYLHGGGWTVGTLDAFDPVCRALATASGALIASIGYRLAPEHPFPAAPDDARAAVRWLADQAEELGADPARLAIAGDSAGGNLAAVAAQHLRDAGHPLTAQLLIYPATDLGAETESSRENAEGYFLDTATMTWFGDQYAGPAGADGLDRTDPRLSPAHGELPGLAPAVVVTAQCDPLRDDGDAYARALEAAGVHVEHRQYPGLIHGFVDMGRHSPAAEAAVRETCRLFGDLLHR